MNPLVIYHNNCADGFTSAWIATKFFKPEIAELLPVNYGEDYSRLHEKIKDREVFVLDFSFKRDLMITLQKLAKSFLVLDHHKTAKEECAGLDFCKFDLTKSGAMLTWEHLHPSKMAPPLVEYVQDRDLWKWKLDESQAINAVIQSHEFKLEVYDDLHERLLSESGKADMIKEGKTINRIRHAAMLGNIKYPIMMRIGEHCVPVINNPTMISETVEMLCTDQPFAAAFFLRQDGKWQFSLRSRPPKGIDVSAIAKQYGGGGHPQAAGFEIPLNDLANFLKV